MADSYTTTTVSLPVRWDMWWGVNGNHWELRLDGSLVHSASLVPDSSNAAQSGSTTITVSGSGSHVLEVQLCNVTTEGRSCAADSKQITLSDTTASSGGSTGTGTGTGTSGGSSTPPSVGETPVVLAAGINGEQNKVYQQNSGKVIANYFVEWGVYGRNYHVGNIPASNMTHLLYAFLAICGDNPQAGAGAQAAIASECASKQPNQVTLIDRFAALQKTYPGDTWIDDTSGSQYNGNFGQLKKLKARYPHLRILPSVGGWTLSTPFYGMAKDPAKRKVFVDSVVAFLKKYDFFDGVDIDWEYPVDPGADAGLGSLADRDAYTALMRDLRTAFDTLSAQTGRTYQVTSAVGMAPSKINAMDYAQAHQYMDYIFIMSYDMAGAWESSTGHHTALFGNNDLHAGFNTANAVNLILGQGVPAGKLVVGAAYYGRGWSGVQNTGTHAPELFPLYGQGVANTKGTWEPAIFDYRDLKNNYIGANGTGINGYTAYYDSIAEAAYLWKPSTGEFISYDSPRSVKAKASYVNTQGLGGFLAWEIDADNGELLNAINEGLGNTEVK